MSRVADTRTPRAVSVSKGQLEYQTSASSEWIPLKSYNNNREPPSTIHEIVFREKNISFVQHTCGGAVTCGVRLSPMYYGSRIKIGTIESGPSLPSDITIELTREQACPTTCRRSADAGKKPNHTLEQCPLAQVCQSFSAMRLHLPRNNFEPKLRKSSRPNEFWFNIVNALRRDLDSVPQPVLNVASVGDRSVDLSSSPKKSAAPSVPKVDVTSVEERFSNHYSSQKKSNPSMNTSTSTQQVAPSKKTSTPAQQAAPPKRTSTSAQQVAPPKKTSTSAQQAAPPNKTSTSAQQAAPAKKTDTPAEQRANSSKSQGTQEQKTPTRSSLLAAKSVQKPPTTLKQQPIPPKSQQTSVFVQPIPPKSKRSSPLAAKSMQKPPTIPKQQPVPPKPQQTSAFLQPIPPKPKQTSEFAQSQGFLIPETANEKPPAEPKPVNPQPRRIKDYKDLDSIPSGSTDLDYGNPVKPSQKGSASIAARPKWEASIIEFQKFKEAAEQEGDKAMADKAKKMIKFLEGDAASPGKETQAQVENFKRLWTLM